MHFPVWRISVKIKECQVSVGLARVFSSKISFLKILKAFIYIYTYFASIVLNGSRYLIKCWLCNRASFVSFDSIASSWILWLFRTIFVHHTTSSFNFIHISIYIIHFICEQISIWIWYIQTHTPPTFISVGSAFSSRSMLFYRYDLCDVHTTRWVCKVYGRFVSIVGVDLLFVIFALQVGRSCKHTESYFRDFGARNYTFNSSSHVTEANLTIGQPTKRQHPWQPRHHSSILPLLLLCWDISMREPFNLIKSYHRP